MKNYTGKTLEEVLSAASADFGCSADELNYTVVEEKKGILGLGSSITIAVEEPVEEEVAVEEDVVVEETPAEPETVKEEAVENTFSMDDVKEFIFDYLGNFFTGIDEDIEVAIEEREDGFVVNLNAENNAVLIGKMGKTIAAFNTVVKGAVNAQFKHRVNVLIDVNHYKEDRYARLRSMAKRTGKQVQRSKVDVELDPMPNDERKVIHKALSEWHNLRTDSEGEGSNRHVCIRYVADREESEAE